MPSVCKIRLALNFFSFFFGRRWCDLEFLITFAAGFGVCSMPGTQEKNAEAYWNDLMVQVRALQPGTNLCVWCIRTHAFTYPHIQMHYRKGPLVCAQLK